MKRLRLEKNAEKKRLDARMMQEKNMERQR